MRYASEPYVESGVPVPTGDFQKHFKGRIPVIKIFALYKDPLLKESKWKNLWELLPPIRPACYISLFHARQRQQPKVVRTQGCGSGQGWENRGRQEIVIVRH